MPTRRRYDENAPPAPAPAESAKEAPAKPKTRKMVDLPPLMDAIKKDVGAKLAKRGCLVGTAEELDAEDPPARFLTTGIYALDYTLTGGDGLPLGRTIEIFGNESSGKTALCEFIMGRTKKVGGSINYLDYEHSEDADHLACYGIKPGDYLRPDLITLEDGWDYIDGTLKTVATRNEYRAKHDMEVEPPVLFVWDSLAQSPAEAEMNEKNHEDSHMALVARGMAKGFRKHTRLLAESDVLFICVNQVRDKPGAMGPGPKTDTPGGRAAKFAYSIRLRMAMVQTLRKGDTPVGQVVEITTVKNKHHPKGQKATIILSYFRGIDVAWSNFLWLQEHGYIVAAGTAGYRWKGTTGEDTFKRKEFAEWAGKNKGVVKDAVKAIYAKLDAIVSGMQDTDDEDADTDPT